ncbi:MAG TPA: hypothetical protein VFG50_06435, partial [Rhodothermales bacterium]|nr:hypothetical protein [Rhodothermales bacterium]
MLPRAGYLEWTSDQKRVRPMRRFPAPHTSIALLLLAAFCLAGCEADLPTRDHFETPFSMYGVLSPDLDSQSVRVYATEDFPSLGSAAIDAVVTSKDLTTGETRTWTDSVIVDPNGQHEHVFWSPFRAEYGHRYHVEVTRPSDGASAFAEARVPSPVTVQFDQSQSPDIYVTIKGKGMRLLRPEAVYSLEKPFLPPNTYYPILSYSISYEGQQEQIAGGWQFRIRLNFDHDKVEPWYLLDTLTRKIPALGCRQLILHHLRFRAVVGDSIWNPPGGVFDPRVLSHPKAMSNVEGGFGFVGAGYRIDEDIDLSREAVEKACFIYFNP